MSLADFQEKREAFKEKYGIDIMTGEGQLLLKKELYKRDIVKFINELVMIEDKDMPGIVIDFKLWPEQVEALKTMDEERFTIFLKSRQLGISWLALSYITHGGVFEE